MDVQTIDNQYNQLQSQAQQTVGELKDLAQKLQSAAAAGNPDAREWLLDLKSVALAIQAEQNQVSNLLQSLHNYVDNANQQLQQMPPQQQGWGNQNMQQPYPQQGYQQGYAPQQGGLFGGLFNSGFGRAIVTGAGFGIGDDLINKIF
jgi:hypothetical protein